MNKFHKKIYSESQSWVKDEIITNEQAELICNKYKDNSLNKKNSFAYLSLIALAYMFIGIAIILLISQNWDEIPRVIRMSSIIGFLIVTYVYAMQIYEKNENKAKIIFFFSNLVYGVAIILIAQTYHLGEHMPDGVLWWAIGSIPIALLLRSNWLLILPLFLSSIWFYLELYLGFYKPLYIVFLLIYLYGAFKFERNNFLFILIVFLSLKFIIVFLNQFMEFREIDYITFGYSFMVFLYSISLFLVNTKVYNQYGNILKTITFYVLYFILFVFTFLDSNKAFLFDAQNLIFIYFVPLTIIIFGLIVSYLSKNLKDYLPVFVVFNFIFFLPFFIDIFENIYILQGLFNIIFLISSIYLVIKGTNTNKANHFFIGIIGILALAFFRYVDLVGGYIGGAILFIVLAIVMLLSAKYWNTKGKKND